MIRMGFQYQFMGAYAVGRREVFLAFDINGHRNLYKYGGLINGLIFGEVGISGARSVYPLILPARDENERRFPRSVHNRRIHFKVEGQGLNCFADVTLEVYGPHEDRPVYSHAMAPRVWGRPGKFNFLGMLRMVPPGEDSVQGPLRGAMVMQSLLSESPSWMR